MPTPSQPLPFTERAQTKPYWEACERHELHIQRCNACGAHIWYPQSVCHRCNSWDLAWVKMSGRGRVFSWIVLQHALHPAFVEKLPLPVALVELEDAPEVRITTNLVDVPLEEIHIGMPVEAVFREMAEGVTMPFFRPTR